LDWLGSCKRFCNPERFGNKSYCKEIINDTIRNDCENLEITPAQPHKSECSVDADCGVKGKFGEFCVPINKTITIDEKKPWKKIYGCYNKTTCGCIDGECRWTPTDDFVDCIDTVENEEIDKVLEIMPGIIKKIRKGSFLDKFASYVSR